MTSRSRQNRLQSVRAFYGYLQGSFDKTTNCKTIPHKTMSKREQSPNLIFCIRSGLNQPCKKQFLLRILSLFWKFEQTYLKQNVNQSKRVRKDGVFRGLPGLVQGISQGRNCATLPQQLQLQLALASQGHPCGARPSPCKILVTPRHRSSPAAAPVVCIGYALAEQTVSDRVSHAKTTPVATSNSSILCHSSTTFYKAAPQRPAVRVAGTLTHHGNDDSL